MSDSDRTPRGTARVNSERFATELAAVWYAANYYTESSYKKGREYIGSVFRAADGKFGITVRIGGPFQSRINVFDVPRGTVATAVWHTHVPVEKMTKDLGKQILLSLMTSFDADWDEFSGDDMELAKDNTIDSKRVWGHSISIYLVTPSLIRRYTPGLRQPEKTWKKEPPSRLRLEFGDRRHRAR